MPDPIRPGRLSTPPGFAPLREQLMAAAAQLAGGGATQLGALLSAMVADVERATAEPLEIFPVCHHSPAAAIQMVQRLREGRPPKVIFLELCEDLRPLLAKLRDCKLPVALQAFAGQSDAFPKSWTPLSVVAPLTEFSAEYQAIAYCMENPGTEMVFVDRSVDHVFQWMPQEEGELEKHLPGGGKDGQDGSDDAPADVEEGADEDGAAPVEPAHGGAVGVQVGQIEPTFPLFHDFLLKNARVRYFAEWWDRYVEQPLLTSDYETYRQVMALVGSLLRRLGRKAEHTESDRQRERFMWTRMKDHLAAHKVDPRDALHVCGAIHAVSDVEEYGSASAVRWEPPAASGTAWLYGLLPSSYRSIDWQFRLPPGTVTLADAQWDKGKRALALKHFVLSKPAGKGRPARGKGKPPAETEDGGGPAAPEPEDGDGSAAASPTVAPAARDLMEYLTRANVFVDEDHAQLLAWCVGIVALARRNGYLASTADAIAVYHASVLLGQLRNRATPTAYDFRDAAVTCLEKGRTPKKRDIPRLCDVLLGGDRIGRVGRDSLPALAQNVYDRLAGIGVNLQATTVQRALLDYRKRPDLLPASDLLWKLWYLLGPSSVKPIMGEKVLGQAPLQESWEVYVGRNQTPLITLGYEGVTVEQVLERRLTDKAFGAEAGTVNALAAAEECLLFLGSPRLTDEIGRHAVDLLMRETGAQTAPQIFDRARRLIHYFRSTPAGLPAWIKSFVTTGYSHYTTLLPNAFADRGTSPEQVASMLAFVFTLESLALSLGCQRSQLAIAVRQSGPVTDDPHKTGLLWTAEWLLGLRAVETIRAFFDELLDNPLTVASMPAYLNGHLLALKFTPLAGPLVVELTSKAFARLPEPLLMPWMPGLITMLRAQAEDVLPPLLKEAGRALPACLNDLRGWVPPWERVGGAAAGAGEPQVDASGPPGAGDELTPEEAAIGDLLGAHRASGDAVCRLIGVEPKWPERRPVAGAGGAIAHAGLADAADPTHSINPAEGAAGDLLARHPHSLNALAGLMTPTG